MQTLRFNSRPLRFLSKTYTVFRVPYKKPTNVAMLFGILGPSHHRNIREYYQPVISVSPSYSNVILQENLAYYLDLHAFIIMWPHVKYPSAYNVMYNNINNRLPSLFRLTCVKHSVELWRAISLAVVPQYQKRILTKCKISIPRACRKTCCLLFAITILC